MKKDFGIGKEIYFVSHLITLVAMTIFSAVIILLNILLGWEKWTIPVIAVGLGLCIALHISGKSTPRVRIYSYGLFLIFEIFYYAVNIETLYDSAALIVMLMVIFAMSGERLLVVLGAAGGLGGMVLHLMLVYSRNGFRFDPTGVIRSVWQFMLVVLGAVLADRLSVAWFKTEKKYQDRIDTILDENERANNFLANVSHEIRTPINAVMGLAAIMEKEDIPENIKGNMSAIAEAGHRVADQIGDIMDYTEIDMKHLSVSEDRYMINSVVNDLISQLRFTEDYGLDLVIDLSPDVPCEMVGDDSKIKKILRHLITNGFKFSSEGGVRVRIYTKPREYGVNLELEVTDTGVGMSDSEIEHIYEKFYQADSGRSRTAGGLGLGIPIVNGLARAMGGFIHLESTPGRGTLVRVSIPQEVSDKTPCITVSDRENILAAGFLGFMTSRDSRTRDFHMEMVSNFVRSLELTFHRVKSREELERLVGSCRVTHLFVGTAEYRGNKDYIDALSESVNVILVEDTEYRGDICERIAVMQKPFYGVQIANYLNSSYVSGESADRERMTCPGIRVLVVDDEPMNLLVARGIFETYGMQVFTASGGPEAIELCTSEDYDIIFMDHMMPGMDGVEVMKRLRLNAAKENRELCIVALTANAISSAREMFISEGFDAFLPKPVELMELERVLKHVLPRSAIVYERLPSKKPKQQSPTERRVPVLPKLPPIEWPEQESADIPVPPPEPETEPAPPAAAESDSYRALRDFGVDISEGLAYCQDDDDFYREILAEYAGDPESKLNKLAELFAAEDMKDYCIRVHSIKSTSKTIGADALSEQAKALEMASKEGDRGFVNEHHPAFAEDYRRLLALINELLNGTPSESAPEAAEAPAAEIPADSGGSGSKKGASGGAETSGAADNNDTDTPGMNTEAANE